MKFFRCGSETNEEGLEYYYLFVGRFIFLYFPTYETSSMRGVSVNTSRRWYLFGFDFKKRLTSFEHGETLEFIQEE